MFLLEEYSLFLLPCLRFAQDYCILAAAIIDIFFIAISVFLSFLSESAVADLENLHIFGFIRRVLI